MALYEVGLAVSVVASLAAIFFWPSDDKRSSSASGKSSVVSFLVWTVYYAIAGTALAGLVLCEVLADRPVQPVGGRAVVPPDVENERVVQFALAFDFVDHATRVVIGVLGESGEDFHQSALERLFVLGN